jgi:hypothetical protein
MKKTWLPKSLTLSKNYFLVMQTYSLKLYAGRIAPNDKSNDDQVDESLA